MGQTRDFAVFVNSVRFENKFRNLTVGFLENGKINRVVDMIHRLEEFEDMRVLTSLF